MLCGQNQTMMQFTLFGLYLSKKQPVLELIRYVAAVPFSNYSAWLPRWNTPFFEFHYFSSFLLTNFRTSKITTILLSTNASNKKTIHLVPLKCMTVS